MAGQGRDDFTPVAKQIPFDNDTNGFVAEDVQAAIEEQQQASDDSASPGYNFGRAGRVNPNTWLQVVGSVPSNLAGITVALSAAKLVQVYVASENIDTFDIAIYEHDGNEINLTLLNTVSIIASRSGTFDMSINITTGKQLAVKLTTGSAKNINVGTQLKGGL